METLSASDEEEVERSGLKRNGVNAEVAKKMGCQIGQVVVISRNHAMEGRVNIAEVVVIQSQVADLDRIS